MGAIFAKLFNLAYEFFNSVLAVINEPFQEHECRLCDCKNYTDEELFIWLREQSRLTTYADTILASGMLNKPLKCSTCKHGRSLHGKLDARLLTPDMLPNGGLVYVEQMARREQQRRADRFKGQNVRVGDAAAEEEQGGEVVTKSDAPDALAELRKTDVKVGDGSEVRPGMELLVHYDAYARTNMEKFETSRDGEPLRMTVGRGDVVKGWDEGIVGTRVGGRRRIEAPARMAFGSAKVLGQRDVDVVFDVRVQAVLSN